QSDSAQFTPTQTKARWGIATVELALILPLLSLVIVGLIEFSRAMVVKNLLTDAARKGCRTGIQSSKGNTDITKDVNDILSDNKLSTSAAKITIAVTDPNGVVLTDAAGAPTGSQVSVTVSIPVSATMFISGYFLAPGTMQSETIVMMKQ